ncbi:MAG: hypothetical protein HQ464_05345 [Planctomycetes bacterium]|nr:hypothetical protein [Planctomycetota bacterium]
MSSDLAAGDRPPPCWPIAAGWLITIAAIAAGGCGRGPGATVEGLVTIGGKPVETGYIRFAPAADDGPTAGSTIDQGRYRAAVAPGRVQVSLQGYKKVGEERPGYDPTGPLIPIMKPLLPSDDLGPAGVKSLNAGRNTLDFAF